MGLQTAFYAAQSALLTTSKQTATVSRNIAGANQPFYSARTAAVETLGDGGVAIGSIQRSTNSALQQSLLSAASESAANNALERGLAQLNQTIGNTQSGTSPAALLSALQNALIQASSAPQNATTEAAALSAVKNLTNGLNQASGQVQNARQQADANMANSVAQMNTLLSQFDVLNTKIIQGTASGQDISDSLDARDQVLSGLAQQVGITTVQNSNGGMAVFTDSGATLYQNGPRMISMAPTTTFTASTNGAAVYVNGQAITGPTATMPIQSGALAGYAQIRDQAAPTYQAQLDEIARGVINSFSQSDQSSPATLPNRTGVVTWPGGPNVPTASQSPGLAASIHIDPAADPAVGGSAQYLQNGGLGGQNYNYNTANSPSFSSRLLALSNNLSTAQSFNANTQLSSNVSLMDLSTQSAAWVGASVQTANTAAATASTLQTQATTALTSATGVSIDQQMSSMLDLEHMYQASAQMMNTVNALYTSLFNAVH